MKKLLCFVIIAVAISATLIISESQALNPFITSHYAADPSAHVFDPDPNTIYVYPSHDEDNAEWFYMVDYHVYSSTDLKKWTDHGVILHLNDVPWKPVKWMWAPDCAYKDGKYYFYFCASTRTDSDANHPKPNDFKIGVAVSDSPTGPFKPEPDGIKDPSDPKGYIWGNDPCVFVDDNGQAYLYWGGQGHGCMQKPKYVKLKSDMKTIDGKPKEIDGLDNWYEATYVHKRKTGDVSTYYLSYATAGPKAKILYATSSSPEGPWNYVGEVIGGNDNCWTNHHSFEEFPKGSDKWYAFYHNADLSDGNGVRRSICVDRLYYNSDRTMQKVVLTRTGTGTSAYQRIKAQLYHEQCGKTKPDPQPDKQVYGTGLEDVKGDIGKCVNWIHNGDWLLYKDIDFGTPTYRGGKLTIEVASPFGPDRGCSIAAQTPNKSFYKNIMIPKTGDGMNGWQTWKSVTVYVDSLPTGKNDIKFVAQGYGNGKEDTLFNFNAFTFSSLGMFEAPKCEIYFKTMTSGKFVAGSVQHQYLYATSSGAPNGLFKIVDAGNGRVAIYSPDKDVYVRAQPNGPLTLTGGKTIDSDLERFTWQNRSDGTFTLKNIGTNQLVCVDPTDGNRLYTRETSSVGSYAKFIWYEPNHASL